MTPEAEGEYMGYFEIVINRSRSFLFWELLHVTCVNTATHDTSVVVSAKTGHL